MQLSQELDKVNGQIAQLETVYLARNRFAPGRRKQWQAEWGTGGKRGDEVLAAANVTQEDGKIFSRGAETPSIDDKTHD